MKPTPVQEPRIPIIVGGLWPNKKPFHRGARWDGMIPHYRGDGVIPAEGVTADQSGDLTIPERPDGAKAEVREMVEYYLERAGDESDLFLPADPPHASGDWIEFCEGIGATWVYTRNLDPETGWNLTMERVRDGPPG